jgi:hypothetical protein
MIGSTRGICNEAIFIVFIGRDAMTLSDIGPLWSLAGKC